MADPVVTISGGIPNSGTGTITTLGQAVAPQGANTATGESGTSGPIRGPMIQGAVTTSSPSYTTGTVNPLSLDLTGSLRAISKIWDGTNTAAVKAGSTAPVVGDAALVVAISPNSVNANGQATMANSAPVVIASNQSAVPISGTITANIGTSGSLALESGGNLASIKTDVDNLNLAQGATTSGQKGNMPLGAVTTAAPTYTTAQLNPLSLNTSGGLRVDGSGVTQPVSGTFWQATQPVSIAAAVTVQQSTAANLNATVTGTVTSNQGGAPWQVVGNVADGVADTGNSVKVGGIATTVNPSGVTNGQRVSAIFDKQGKQVTVGALRIAKGKQKTSITVNTATTVVTAGGAGVFNDVYAIVLTNKSATAVTVDISDGSGTVMTLAAPAGDTRGFTVPVDSAIPQTAAATAWTATVSAAVTSIEITMLYVSNF